MMLRDCKYLFAYLVPAMGFVGIYLQGGWSYGVAIIAFVLVPAIELVAPFSKANHSDEAEATLKDHPFFDWLLYLHVPLLYAMLWYYFQTIQTIHLQAWEWMGLTLSMGVIAGSFGINVGHELGHRNKPHEQLLARLLLLPSLYLHFNIEHNRGHHKWVATPQDPSSARKGENLYAFWVRSVSQVYINAWRLEATRLRRNGKPVLHPSNEMIWFQGIQILYLLVVGALFGWSALLLALAVAVIGFLLLETVNYIEHYGLRRNKLPSGRYETVLPKHSWNSNHELGRIFLYELTRHSDHHYKADRKYQILRHMDDSPQLPYGYPMSMLMALVPPLWFGVMDPRLHLKDH